MDDAPRYATIDLGPTLEPWPICYDCDVDLDVCQPDALRAELLGACPECGAWYAIAPLTHGLHRARAILPPCRPRVA